MDMRKAMKVSSVLAALASLGMLSGCANYEVNTKRGDIPGHYIRYELQEADRAVEAARQAGKDKSCPAEFKAAEAAKNSAYDVFRACKTEEGAALAKQATAKAKALCPKQEVKEMPAPVIPAPTDNLTITPDSITKGQTATLVWSSQNASTCNIQPNIGQVQPQGSLTLTPSDTTAYTLTCNGEGGSAKSTARIVVNAPAPTPVAAPAPVPVVVVAPAKVPVAKLCSPTVIDIKFDTNKADIKPMFHDELKKLADFLKEFPVAKGVIEGYTDNVGKNADNVKLSQRRADSVRKYIINTFGITPERISAKGYGPANPKADNATKEGKLQNRRVEANFTCN
jgi:OOP family OmpA-OmpF porin